AGRDGAGIVSLAEFCAALGRRDSCGERAGTRLDVRDRAAGAGLMKSTASILLVDDDSAFRHVMAGELRRLGHEVETASSGEEALARVEKVEPEIVLLDLRLP